MKKNLLIVACLFLSIAGKLSSCKTDLFNIFLLASSSLLIEIKFSLPNLHLSALKMLLMNYWLQ